MQFSWSYREKKNPIPNTLLTIISPTIFKMHISLFFLSSTCINSSIIYFTIYEYQTFENWNVQLCCAHIQKSWNPLSPFASVLFPMVLHAKCAFINSSKTSFHLRCNARSGVLYMLLRNPGLFKMYKSKNRQPSNKREVLGTLAHNLMWAQQDKTQHNKLWGLQRERINYLNISLEHNGMVRLPTSWRKK